ncbi:MAG TPA: hypothetical protein VEL05_10540 [Candidatus Acidoferrum sp.]|nr:hypothetical protein [Candidatus Acidoferrum sp.]
MATAHHHHQHEADEHEMGVGRDEDARWIRCRQELGHDDIAAEQESRHEEDEARLDVPADERRHG